MPTITQFFFVSGHYVNPNLFITGFHAIDNPNFWHLVQRKNEADSAGSDDSCLDILDPRNFLERWNYGHKLLHWQV